LAKNAFNSAFWGEYGPFGRAVCIGLKNDISQTIFRQNSIPTKSRMAAAAIKFTLTDTTRSSIVENIRTKFGTD